MLMSHVTGYDGLWLFNRKIGDISPLIGLFYGIPHVWFESILSPNQPNKNGNAITRYLSFIGGYLMSSEEEI